MMDKRSPRAFEGGLVGRERVMDDRSLFAPQHSCILIDAGTGARLQLMFLLFELFIISLVEVKSVAVEYESANNRCTSGPLGMPKPTL